MMSCDDRHDRPRALQIANFLAQNQCAATVDWLPADASFRRYGRTQCAGRSVILMDAPPHHESKTAAFVAYATLLHKAGLRAPQILAADLAAGLLLLEDLGEITVARLLIEQPTREAELYYQMYQVLQQLQHAVREPPTETPEISAYDNALLRVELNLLCDWYVPATGAHISDQAWQEFWHLVDYHLASTRKHPQAMVLRDCHQDNFIFVPEHTGIQQYALLDFQDGGWGSALYDVTSLVFDVRRDVAPAVQQSVLRAHAAFVGLDWSDYWPMAAWLVLQRSLKILGIFVRLNVRDGKSLYLRHLPRCWRLIEQALTALPDWQDWFARYWPQAAQSVHVLHADILDSAMLLAAGKGTRMGHFSQHTPKPLLPVAEIPIIEHTRQHLRQQGVSRFVINACHLREQLHAYADNKPDIQVIDESTALETAGGVIHALPLLARDRFWVVNGDCLWRGNTTSLSRAAQIFSRLLDSLPARDKYVDFSSALLLLSPLSRWHGAAGRVDFYLTDAQIDAMTQQRFGRLLRAQQADPQQQAEKGYGYSGIMLIHRAAYSGYAVHPFSHNVIFDALIARGALWGMVWHEDYYHVGDPDALALANQVFATAQKD